MTPGDPAEAGTVTAHDAVPLRRRALFGSAAAGYEEGRPGYPPEVFALLVARCDLGPGVRVLEVGPGPGQATVELLARGASVTAVELDAALAARLRERCADERLGVVVEAFERVAPPHDPADRFDLLVAATSFHWVPPEHGVPHAARMLRPGGWLALWWTYFGDPERPDPFYDAVRPIVERHGFDVVELVGSRSTDPAARPHFLDVAARTGAIDVTGAFGPVEHHLIRWTGRHTAAGMRALCSSFSPWLDLADDQRAALLADVGALVTDRFGGVVERPYLTAVYLAQRRG